jgi:hypothetical protein
LHTQPFDLITTDIDVPVPPVVDPEQREMGRLYEKLAQLLRGKAADHVRIGMYGDSNMTRDFITGEMRRTFQLRCGDAGHGFVSLGQPWSWYLHTDVRHGVDSAGWKPIAMSTHQMLDRLYGFAGIGAQSDHAKAVSWVATALEPAPIGRTVSHIDVYYLKRPHAGTFDIRVDGERAATIDAESAVVTAGFESMDLTDAPHRFDFVSGPKPTRLFGVVLERAQPSIVVDSLGIGGVNVELIVKGDRDLAIQTLRRRHYDLVILLTGATEPDLDTHDKALEQFVQLHREALPQTSILIMSPPDLAGGPSAAPTLNPRMAQLTRRNRRVAEQTRTAFWDFRGAMGGDSSIVRFTERQMAWADYIHLSEKGGRYMGRRIAYAIWREFAQYLSAHPQAGCDDVRR